MIGRLLRKPVLALAVFCLFQVTAWTALPASVSWTVSRDTIESYLWGHEWVVGTYKHPNLPGWALEASRLLTGAVGWPAYLTSQLFVAATYVCVFMLGREMMGPSRALAGTLLLSGLWYTAMPSAMMNHNVAVMPFWAAIAWGLWHARCRPGPLVWAALGAAAALSLYAKLSSALILVTGGLWLLYDPKLRSQLRSPWPWLGLGLCGVLVIPLWRWLLESNFAPLLYARQSADLSDPPLKFIGDQLAVAAGVALIGLFAGLIGRRPLLGPSQTEEYTRPLDPAAIPFLATIIVVPIALTVSFGMGTGSGVSFKWGAPNLILFGLLLVAAASGRFDRRVLTRIALAAGALLCVLPSSFALYLVAKPCITGKPIPESWPQSEISMRFQRIWRERVGKRLKIVAGGRWIAGIVALKPGPMPSILTDGRIQISPWVTAGRLQREGALVVWEATNDIAQPPEQLRSLSGTHPTGTEHFDYPFCPGCKQLKIGYAIVEPESN